MKKFTTTQQFDFNQTCIKTMRVQIYISYLFATKKHQQYKKYLMIDNIKESNYNT